METFLSGLATLTQDKNGNPSSGAMVVGDRGLVVREFSSRLGGIDRVAPSFSVLCDKVELGMPNGLKQLVAGDFVKAKLEILVLPRKGAEFNLAMNNVGSSRSLTQISSMDTSGRVEAQAVRGQLLVTPLRGVLSVDEQYPVVVTAAEDNYVLFDVVGDALGFVPVVISGLNTSALPTGNGLWLKGPGATSFTKLQQQGATGDDLFWQSNFDREQGTYELVFNVQMYGDTTMGFGSDPRDGRQETELVQSRCNRISSNY